MGPTLICDKSSLQAIGKDELSSLRKYFYLNVPPILLIEILADLKKHSDLGESRREVQSLANKIVPACSNVNAEFRYLIRGELAGHEVRMAGVPIITGARQISNAEGKKGFIFEESVEHKALLRWQMGDFIGAEMLLAEAWRASNESIDLEGMQKSLKNAYSRTINLRTLTETASFVDGLLKTASPYQLLTWFLHDARVLLRGNEVKGLEAIRSAPPGSLGSRLPYAAYCIRAALIFHFGLAFSLVSTRATNRLDLEYFYYAPFCHVFSSKDRFHRKMASVIVQDQMFVNGDGLKADLADLARQQATNASAVSETDKTHGPPTNDGSIAYQAWMKTSKAGFSEVAKEVASHLTPEESAKLLMTYKDIVRSKSQSETPSIGMDDCDFIIMEHSVRFDGPCICGSPKLFKDCCGQKLDKKASGLPPAS